MYAGNNNDAALTAAGSNYLPQNLEGACILPGFVEPHVHLVFTALATGYLLDLSPLACPNLDAVLDTIKTNLPNAQSKWGGWVAGFGYDPSRLPADGYPDLTADLLDPISPKTPVFVLNSSGHIAYVNNATFNFVIENSQGKISRDKMKKDSHFLQDANGELSGVLLDSAIAEIVNYLPPPPIDILVSSAGAALRG